MGFLTEDSHDGRLSLVRQPLRLTFAQKVMHRKLWHERLRSREIRAFASRVAQKQLPVAPLAVVYMSFRWFICLSGRSSCLSAPIVDAR